MVNLVLSLAAAVAVAVAVLNKMIGLIKTPLVAVVVEEVEDFQQVAVAVVVQVALTVVMVVMDLKILVVVVVERDLMLNHKLVEVELEEEVPQDHLMEVMVKMGILDLHKIIKNLVEKEALDIFFIKYNQTNQLQYI